MRRFFIILMLSFLPMSVFPKTIWNNSSLYTIGDKLAAGDVLVVKIDDVLKFKFSITIKNDNSFNIVSNPDQNMTRFLPKVSSDKKITDKDDNKFSSDGKFNLSVASIITGRRADGNFNIQGVKEYSMNGRVNRFTVSGIVDPALISGRTISSGDIADFRLEIRGLRETGAALKKRTLKEGEAASTELTEEEKQQIIEDYITRMLRELNK